MDMMRHANKRLKLLAVLSLIIFLMILVFGLRGKGFHFSNDVSWLKDEPGLRFGNFGIAYTLLDREPIKSKISVLDAFSVEIALKSGESNKPDGFKLILTLHDGDDRRQLLVGQYKSYLVVMNGDDYENKRKIRRIAASIFSQPSEKLYLTITTGTDETKLYVNGVLFQAKQDLILKVPHDNTTRLTLGNSVYGSSPWKGEVYGLAFYADRLDTQAVEKRFSAWSETRRFPFPKTGKPFLFFSLDEKTGSGMVDHLTENQNLIISPGFPILEKRFLSFPSRDFKGNSNFFMDFFLNLLGFIPLGMILCALFNETGGMIRKHAVLLSSGFCFLISLSIETTQVWMPSRSSQMMDLILNTLGAFLGVMLCISVLKMKNRD